MAVIDMSGYVADLKAHAAEHGFHIHDERHFLETYNLRQAWEVDLHPEEACGGATGSSFDVGVRPQNDARSRRRVTRRRRGRASTG